MPSYDECLVEAELRARSAYAEPHRHYHNERHLDDCLRQLNQLPDLPKRDRRVLCWAILWHDAVYDPHANDNEERSAKLARRELLACGVAGPDADEVARLILLTKGHLAEQDDRIGALMVSIDLSVLGSDEGRYSEYIEGVRREYAHVPDDRWKAARSAVLERLLAAHPIYPNTWFHERFETQARHNIKCELKAIGAS